MSIYQQLNLDLVEAIQHGTLEDFIHQMNQRLALYPSEFMTWLFVSRAYSAKGDVENATNSYKQLLRIAVPGHRNNEITLREIVQFSEKTNRNDLLDFAKARFGDQVVDQLTNSQSGSQKISVRDNTENRKLSPSATKEADSKRSNAPVLPKSQPILNGVNADKLIAESREAFNNGDLELALTKVMAVYQSGVRTSGVYILLSQTLQRLRRFDDAQHILDEGIHATDGEPRLALVNLKAQIYSSEQAWEEASQAYIELIRGERRLEARRFAQLQLARIYRQLGKNEEATKTLQSVLKASPGDQVALALLAAISTPLDNTQEYPDIIGDEAVRELEVDVSDEGVELISPMLRRDLTLAEYRDEAILRKGGQPDTSDADRLLALAESSKGSEFGERYPLFLESAKAYNELPDGSYQLTYFYRALIRYAMLRGGAYISAFRRRILSGETDIDLLRRLRDSATSYYLESLALQVQVDFRFALVPLTNHLRVQIAFANVTRGNDVRVDLFDQSFAELFKLCLENPDDDIVRIAYESVVACGAASGRVWNQLLNMRGGPGIMFRSLDQRERRQRPYSILSTMSEQIFSVTARPGEVLQAAFVARREQIQQILTFFTQMQQNPLDVPNLRELNSRWHDFPIHRGTLLDTDMELHAGVEAILSTLLPYQSRSQEERTAMLFSARTNIENLLRFIQENPTYWGRIGFEPLLTRWKSAIRIIETRRLSEIQPKLQARLEPPVFQTQDGHAVGGISLRNVGSGTAEGAALQVRLLAHNTDEVICDQQNRIDTEISVGGTIHFPIRFDQNDLSEQALQPYRIQVYVAPLFRGSELEASSQEFTLEIHSGAEISVEDIPWNEVDIPPEHLFKGREALIGSLREHIRSRDRNITYILYGLTRTGKSSILRYLSKELDLMPMHIKGVDLRCISFSWNMGDANAQTNAPDMWEYLLKKETVDKLATLADLGQIPQDAVPTLRNNQRIRFRDWGAILSHLKEWALYPVFLVDEFSYYRTLVDSRRIDASFLAAIRTFAIDGQASFFFAGTYDLRKLIADPSYGITGQFVNAREIKVSQIDQDSAIELIRAMEPKLRFTDEAIEQILDLSHRIPYFVQILCRYCAMYAVGTRRTIIGYPELESVVQVLTGETKAIEREAVPPLAAGAFMNNMDSKSDPVEFQALLSTICELNRGYSQSRCITYSEIQETWHRAGVRYFQAKLATAIRELCDREVLLASEDEGMPAYRISVDLFRRWWANEHRYLNVELDVIKEVGY